MVTVFDRFVWLRNRFAPGKALTAFAEDSGVSHATVSSLYRRWRDKTRPDVAPGNQETWHRIAATWNVRAAWLTSGDGSPISGVMPTESELDGLSREFDARAPGSGSYLAAQMTPKNLPPQPLRGQRIPDQVRFDAATFLLARKRPDDPTRYLTQEEVWAGFRNVAIKDAADANLATAVAAAVMSTILGEDEVPVRRVRESDRAARRRDT